MVDKVYVVCYISSPDWQEPVAAYTDRADVEIFEGDEGKYTVTEVALY